MHQISVSEIQRNLHKLDDFDIIEIVDKKRNKIKGYFIESKYASFVEELAHKVQNRKESKTTLRGILHAYAGSNKRDEESTAWKDHLIRKYSHNDQA